MYFFIIILLMPLLIVCNGNCDKNDKKLLELKSDVEKIGTGFENLAFDVMEQIMDKVRTYEVNGDYYMSDESASKEANTQRPITQVYAPKKLTNNIEKSNIIHKRSIEENTIPNDISDTPIMENAVVEASFINDTTCSRKTLEEQNLERQHIEDLKEEVKKLYDLVVLLKDQQKIMTLLDQESKHLDSDLSKRFDAKDLLKILDHVNNKDTLSKDIESSDINQKRTDDRLVERATHEELAKIKLDLRAAIGALNKTKEILAMERRKEINLEDEIKDHRIELSFLKLMIQKLYENNTGFHTKNNISNEILGAPPHLPKELPTKDKLAEGKENTSGNKHLNEADTVKGRISVDHTGKRSRSSDLDDLERIIHKIRKPKKDDLESRMIELKQEVEKKKQEEEIVKQLETLQKFVAEQKEAQKTKSLSSDESTLKKLLDSLKDDKPQSKNLDDDDVELELQKLQNAIDNLRPKDDLDSEPKRDESAQLRKLLTKLMKQESKQDDVNVSPSNKTPPLSPKQIAELKKQLDEMSYGNMKGMGGNMYSGGGGYGYGPQFADLFGRGPPSQFFTGGFGNLPQPYPPYNRMLNNGGAYTPPNNVPINSYLPSTNSFQSQSFGLTSNIRPGATGQASTGYNRNLPIQASQGSSSGNIGQNGYHASTEIQHKQFGTPMAPSQYNFGTIQQSSSESFRGQLNPYNVAPSIDQAYNQGLSELHQKLFASNSGQNSPKPLPYSQISSGGQSSIQKEIKNQFFLAPQPAVYERPAANPIYAQGNAAGGSQDKSGDYPQQNSGSIDYGYQKIDDLRTQVDSLQGVINSMNRPGYVQKPEDLETVTNLERQINELKGVIRGLTQDLTPNQPSYGQNIPIYDQNIQQQQQQPPNYQKMSGRRRRSTEDNHLDGEDSDLYDQVVSKLKQVIFENDTRAQQRSNYDDVERKIADLKSQLEHRLHTPKTGQERHFSPIHPPHVFQNSYQSSYNQYGSQLPIVPLKISKNPLELKKEDIFTTIVLKILDKLLAAAPAILQKLLGFGFGQLFSFDSSSYGGDYGSNYGDGYNVGYGGQNSIQGIFKSFGIFGYLPLIILKIIDGITVFVNVLKKNKFFKNFLLPALVLLLVAGSVLFLIWWLQPNEDFIGLSQQGYDKNYGEGYNKNYGYDYNKNYGQPANGYQNYGYNDRPNYGYGNENYGPRRSYNSPVYSRSYFESRR